MVSNQEEKFYYTTSLCQLVSQVSRQVGTYCSIDAKPASLDRYLLPHSLKSSSKNTQLLFHIAHMKNLVFFSFILIFQMFFLKYGPIPASLSFIFVLCTSQFNYKLKKVQMECLGFEPETAGLQAQTKPQSYGKMLLLLLYLLLCC